MTGTTISSYTTTGLVLTLASQNPVTITAAGTVASTGNYAINGLSTQEWRIYNYGEISGGYTYYGQYTQHGVGGAIALGGSGIVANGSAGHVTSSIFGSTFGIKIGGTGSSVINFGMIAASARSSRITSYGTTYAPAGIGVMLANGGSVANYSSGVVSGGSIAIYIDGSTGFVNNTGTIIGGGKSSYKNNKGQYIRFGPEGGGIFSLFAGEVINGAPGQISAQIVGAQFGVDFVHYPGIIANYGTISGGGYSYNGGGSGASGEAIIFSSGGRLVNGSIADTNANVIGDLVGVFDGNGDGYVTNFGSIVGSFGTGIELISGGTIINAGTIAGGNGIAVSFYKSEGLIVIDPGAVFQGMVFGGAGSSSLELASAPVWAQSANSAALLLASAR